MSYIYDISTAVPDHSFSQAEFTEFYTRQAKDSISQRQARFISTKTGIDKRHSVLRELDVLLEADTKNRMTLYKEHAPKLAARACKSLSNWDEEKQDITDLLLVSCTGMYSPGLEFDLIANLGLNPEVKRTNIHFMGCYAAITALRLAQEITSNPNRKVLLISVELCTLHFQNSFEPDYLYSNYLFADGAAAVLIGSQQRENSLKIQDSASKYIPDTGDQMSWKISNNGFMMTLSSKVPNSLLTALDQQKIFPQVHQDFTDWAVHPGGVQILSAVEEAFNLGQQSLANSKKVLKEYGNMSSPTILFIIKDFLQSKGNKEHLIASAFGPGLVMENTLLAHV